jgi:hypothetical protein
MRKGSARPAELKPGRGERAGLLGAVGLIVGPPTAIQTSLPGDGSHAEAVVAGPGFGPILSLIARIGSLFGIGGFGSGI